MNTEPVKASLIPATLQELAKSNPTAEAIALDFAVRGKLSTSTNLKALQYKLLREGVLIVSEDFFGYFKKLEELGAGSVIHARKGDNQGPRFEWNYSLTDIGHMSFADQTIVQAKKDAKQAPKTEEPSAGPRPIETKSNKKFNRSAVMKARWAARKAGKDVKPLGRPAGTRKTPAGKTDRSEYMRQYHLKNRKNKAKSAAPKGLTKKTFKNSELNQVLKLLQQVLAKSA